MAEDLTIDRGVALSSKVHAALAERIATGRIAPRERMVAERLAEQLGVSPMPVREAISRLMQEGLIEAEANGRYRVVRPTPEQVINTYTVRAALEGLAAQLAAPRISDEHLAALRDSLSELDQAVERWGAEACESLDDSLTQVVRDAAGNPVLSLDDSLHQVIRDAAGNPVLSRELRPLQIYAGLVSAYVARVCSGEQLAKNTQRSHEEHKRIVEALAARDARLAREVMQTHVLNGGERYANLIDAGHAESIWGAGTVADTA